jgi:hypothetical protein
MKLHVSDRSSLHHQGLFTVHSAMVYVIQLCRQLSNSRIRPVPSWSCCSKAVYMTCTIAECTVNNSWWWTEELSETCRVSFQNKFEKLVRLVGYYKGICHDARPHVTMHGHMNVKFLGAFAKLQKATTFFVKSVCLSVRMERLDSHWMDFHGIWYLSIFRKYFDKSQV